MTDIVIKKAHSFDLATARSQAQKWLEETKNKLGLDIVYTQGELQDSAHIHKAGVDAKATLDAQAIVFEAKLAFFAKPLKSLIHSGIQEGLDKYFP